ncbi:MAG: aldehyde dehydrogenase family protein, partial [Candidatus Diapherotrites archaeon]|nr:aldehyde dehydrogenase family protein [Candidatus Diapherotrites archaeon]
NTIVFKPASDSPLCALEFVRILVEAGVPKGVVNLVTGSGSNVGAPMVRHELIRSISFTGSRDIGQFIASEGGHYLKRVTLELGGKNPIIIMDDADLKLAVDGCVWGAFGTTGQRCTAASRIIVHKSVKDSFLRAFVKRAKELRVGDGSKKTMDMGPLVNEDALKKVQRYVDIGRSEGAKLVCGGHAMKGWFFEPTIFDNVNVGMKVAQDEIFGPVVCIIEAKDLDDAIRKANSVEYGLSTAIYTRDVSNAFRAIEGLEAGLTYVNASTIGSEVHLPFGGVKKTGNGTREAGIEGINEFSETKTVYVDYSGRLQRAQIDVD